MNSRENIYSSKVRAGKRRTYFFDVRKTKGEDYYITVTESTRKFNDQGYERHKIFLYKEDFNRFMNSLNEVVNYVKTDLMPDFDYEMYERRQAEWEASQSEENKANDSSSTSESTETADSTTESSASEEAPKKEETTDDDMSW